MATRGKRILITGGAGFLETPVCLELAAENRIIIYDCLWRNAIHASRLLEHVKKLSAG